MKSFPNSWFGNLGKVKKRWAAWNFDRRAKPRLAAAQSCRSSKRLQRNFLPNFKKNKVCGACFCRDFEKKIQSDRWWRWRNAAFRLCFRIFAFKFRQEVPQVRQKVPQVRQKVPQVMQEVPQMRQKEVLQEVADKIFDGCATINYSLIARCISYFDKHEWDFWWSLIKS